MRISAKGEYACVAMLELAAGYPKGQPVRIKAIAEAQGVPQQFLVQILLQLKTAGLVLSVRGASGGYQLARAPEQITLADVIQAVDERTLSPHSALGDAQPTPAVEVLLGVWRELHEHEQRHLRQLTLAELIRRTQASSALLYHI